MNNTCVSNPKLVSENTGAGPNILPQPNPVQDPDPLSQINGGIRILIRIRLLKFPTSYLGFRIRILNNFIDWLVYLFVFVDFFVSVSVSGSSLQEQPNQYRHWHMGIRIRRTPNKVNYLVLKTHQ